VRPSCVNPERNEDVAIDYRETAFGLAGFGQFVRPGRRPLSSMSPIIVLKDGKPVAGDGDARRQPHHCDGGTNRRRCVRLQDGYRRRGGRPARASSMDAG
jgi:hypothetical protein